MSTAPTVLTSTQIAELVNSFSYSYSSEIALQDGIEQVLTDAGVAYAREVTLAGGRIDFLIGAVGVEIKVEGAPMRVLGQLQRYAHSVDELLLITTRAAHRTLPNQIAGVPLRVLFLGGLR